MLRVQDLHLFMCINDFSKGGTGIRNMYPVTILKKYAQCITAGQWEHMLGSLSHWYYGANGLGNDPISILLLSGNN